MRTRPSIPPAVWVSIGLVAMLFLVAFLNARPDSAADTASKPPVSAATPS